jgi:hypothetical protein
MNYTTSMPNSLFLPWEAVRLHIFTNEGNEEPEIPSRRGYFSRWSRRQEKEMSVTKKKRLLRLAPAMALSRAEENG